MKPTRSLLCYILVAAALILNAVAPPASAQDKSIILQSTTSTANSGLLDVILPEFKRNSGIDQSPQSHVATDSAHAIEVGCLHA